MQLKIFSGAPETLQAEVTAWMQQHRHRISHVLQSQSMTGSGQALLSFPLLVQLVEARK